MALNSSTKKSNQGRDIKYLNKDFSKFRENLIEYAKTYFPQTYSDFNESSPGMMFIEMASYLGDVLSYYTDDTLKESLMLYSEDKQNECHDQTSVLLLLRKNASNDQDSLRAPPVQYSSCITSRKKTQ